MTPNPPEETPQASSDDDRRAELAFATVLLGGLVLTAVLYTLFSSIVALLLVSGLLAYAVLPLVDVVARRLPRSLAVLVIGLGLVGLIALLVVLLTPYVATELSSLPNVIGELVSALRSVWEKLRGWLPGFVTQFVEGLLGSLRQAMQRASPTSGTVADVAGGAAQALSAFASGIVFVPIFVFLMLRSYHSFVGGMARGVPPRWRKRFFARMHEADNVLSGFVRGQLLVASMLAAIYGTAFSIVGIPLGLIVGILAGLGEIVPFLGSIIAVVFGSLMALAGGHPSDILWVIGIYFVVQAVQGAVVSPWILGRRAQIGPAVVIVALAVGGQLFGLIGLLLSVPTAGLLKVAGRAAASAYRDSHFFRARAPA